MAALGVVEVRHVAETPGPLPRAFIPVENAVDVGRVEIAGTPPQMKGSPPRGDDATVEIDLRGAFPVVRTRLQEVPGVVHQRG